MCYDGTDVPLDANHMIGTSLQQVHLNWALQPDIRWYHARKEHMTQFGDTEHSSDVISCSYNKNKVKKYRASFRHALNLFHDK